MNPQEELFVDLYFEFNFNAPKAYRHAGYAPRNADANAYSKLRQAHIQAAIHRRRAALRETHAATREEKIQLLETCMRDGRVKWVDRLRAIMVHNAMTGEGFIPQGNSREADRMTATALRALSVPELIDKINRGLIPQARARIMAEH